MLTWIDESNKYEEIHKAYFGSCEITVIKFAAGGARAWARKIPSVSTILKKTYDCNYSIDEVKEDFIKSLREFLDERVVYWMTIQHDLWNEVQWLDDVEE